MSVGERDHVTAAVEVLDEVLVLAGVKAHMAELGDFGYPSLRAADYMSN